MQFLTIIQLRQFVKSFLIYLKLDIYNKKIFKFAGEKDQMKTLSKINNSHYLFRKNDLNNSLEANKKKLKLIFRIESRPTGCDF